MPQYDWLFMMGLGVLFILLGIGGLILGSSEEKGWYRNMSANMDVREYLEHTPFRPFLGAFKIGGRICLAIGFLGVIAGVVLLVRHLIA